MRVREETWEEYREDWLRYEARKRDLVERVVEVRATATGTGGGERAYWRGLTAAEYEAEIADLCAELHL